ncbi:hypothetical protein, partial [Mesorhizobium sp. M2E.F.Ca.ET.209.01.1.1]|uniref:hypothetical protein n=1 Tax=Mesorhizobium sp. M2E.F.Ca.ET.209.01.1.1 TaxID=2500526 RepID=UPI001AEE4CB8
ASKPSDADSFPAKMEASSPHEKSRLTDFGSRRRRSRGRRNPFPAASRNRTSIFHRYTFYVAGPARASHSAESNFALRLQTRSECGMVSRL